MLTNVRKSKEHLILELLRSRRELSKEEAAKLWILQSGYEGEQKFASLLTKFLTAEHITHFDFIFDAQGSITQIDCYIILSHKIILIEVKNFKGEYVMEDGVFKSLTTDKKYQNPLYQLHRAENNVTNLLESMQVNLPLQAFVVFVHDQFTLYANYNEQIILPTQLEQFLMRLNNDAKPLTQNHHEIARHLAAHHLPDNPSERMPTYDFQSLHKWIFCAQCRQATKKIRNHIFCSYCQIKENFTTAILRSTFEFHLLFPKQLITKFVIYEWCGKLISQSTIQRALSSHLQKQNKTSHANYVYTLNQEQ